MANSKTIFYKDRNKEWRWKTIAGNNQQTGNSGESFTTKQNAVKNAQNNGYRGTGKRNINK